MDQRRSHATVSIETVLWLTLLAVTALTRFWDLGYRTLHHDESLHVHYSWTFATGEIPYVHNPLMHGPFLFHTNALVYRLLGESTTTSRLLPALAGVLIVALPWLLRGRRHLGRWGALAAGTMLCISPAMLYYTRFIRHDPYTVLGSLLLCVAIFRYLERPQRRWMLTAFVTVGLLLANHEVVFAILLAFVLMLWGALVVTRLPMLISVHALAAVGGLALLVANRVLEWPPLPAIPWRRATPEATRAFYDELVRHPFVVCGVLLAIGFVLGCAAAILMATRERPAGTSVREALLGDAPPGSVGFGVSAALADWPGLLLGSVAMIAILVTLFSTFGTNPDGLATMTYAPDGTLLYWLGQQGERRGQQPWFYFITGAMQYEWLSATLAIVGVGLAAALLARTWRMRCAPSWLPFAAFCAGWTVFLFLVLSWAGEKMPWLIVHIVAPGALLGGRAIEEVSATVRRHASAVWRPPALALAGGLVVLAFGGFFLAARLTAGEWVALGDDLWLHRISAEARASWWTLALMPLAGLAIITLGAVRFGVRVAAIPTIAAALLVMSTFQLHAGFRVSYLDGDGARDTLIYNTVGSDVMQLERDLEAMSLLAFGDRSMPIVHDQCTQWPLNVSFRRMTDVAVERTVSASDDVQPAVIVGVTQRMDAACSMPDDLPGYTIQRYIFRWHEPEVLTYRRFAIAPELPPGFSALENAGDARDLPAIAGSIWSSTLTLTDPDGQQRAFRLVMVREMPGGVLQYPVNVYIRNDLLPAYNTVRYGD